jgi:5-hydroxyisourate hydrolase-like protein (transthyretin family)
MAEYPVPPRRAPRKKLKMPIFGNMMGGSSSGPADSGKNFTTYLFAIVAVVMVVQIYLPQLWAEKLYDSEDELIELTLDGSIRKKYTDGSDKNEIHYILVVKEKGNARKKIDLHLTNPDFFDQVAVPFRVKKEAGSLAVRVTRFARPDTVLKISLLKK